MSRKLLSHRNPSLEDLPEELIINILSRLPVTTIICCKCVCKRLRNLVSEIQLPKCLIIHQHQSVFSGPQSGVLKFVEIQEELDHTNLLRDSFMGIDMAKIFPGLLIHLAGSADGLICLRALTDEGNSTYICNPVTREYMIIPKHKVDVKNFWDVKCGFGVSLAGEYKVIRIVMGGPTKIEVYTLGSHQWRNLDVPCELNSLRLYDHGLYLSGHIYWVFSNKLLSFNLDQEKFQLFSSPAPQRKIIYKCLGVLKGCLCYLYEYNKEFVFWIMTKEHEMKNLWHKESEIAKSTLKEMFPIGFIDGSNDQSIFIVQNKNRQLVTYCLETNKFEDTTLSGTIFRIYDYRPSFLKLGNFQSSATIHVF